MKVCFILLLMISQSSPTIANKLSFTTQLEEKIELNKELIVPQVFSCGPRMPLPISSNAEPISLALLTPGVMPLDKGKNLHLKSKRKSIPSHKKASN
jgi:hypothetical protein